MIRKANDTDKIAIYKIWKEMFESDDNGYTDYYFECLFDCNNTLVIEDNGLIISTLQRNPHQIKFNGIIINTSMILGVATIPSRRHEGHMRDLMNYALEQAEKEEIITLIQAYEPKLYRPFGFQNIYYRNRTTYNHNQIPIYENLKIDNNVNAKELVQLYNKFTTHFNAYYIRDEKYYEKYFKEINAEGGKIVAYRNDANIIEGYMVYYFEKYTCDIKEIIYENSWAFLGLMGYAASLKVKVNVHTSNSEKILKLLPGGEVKEYPFAMARVNDYSLLNIMFDKSVQSAEEAFSMLEIPLFLHEYA